MRLKWVEPDDPCGDPVTHYQVQAKRGASATLVADDPTTDGTDESAGNTNFDNLTALANVDATVDSSTVSVFGADVTYRYLNVHPGQDLTRTANGEYYFTGDDLARAKAVVNNPDNGRFVSGYPVDIRIKPKNRKGLATAWFVLDNVPVGDPNVPRKQARPNVQQEQAGNEGRSRLKVSWAAATFNEGKAPPTVTYDPASVDGTDTYDRSGYGRGATAAEKVRYVLEIKGGKAKDWMTETEAQSDRWYDGHADGASPDLSAVTPPGPNGAATRYHVDNRHDGVGADLTTPSVQVTYDGALQSRTKREYRLYAVRVPGDFLMSQNISADTTADPPIVAMGSDLDFGIGADTIVTKEAATDDLIRGFRSEVGHATTARGAAPGQTDESGGDVGRPHRSRPDLGRACG